MTLRLLVVSTPTGAIGSGAGGGVELTLVSLVAGLLERGHAVTVLAPEGSRLPPCCAGAALELCAGALQPSWQHRQRDEPVTMPHGAVLAGLWDRALQRADGMDRVLNLAYDWLPFWLTPHLRTPLHHLVSMGSVSEAMDAAIETVARRDLSRLAFHTRSQAADFQLPGVPTVLGNGFDLSAYSLTEQPDPVLGWVGRIAPEKGLEDAARAAALAGLPLRIWGRLEDTAYAAAVEASVPAGTLEWGGFLPTELLQARLGRCLALLNTPKWNEAFGNVVVEAMACGVPVIAYDRGGPGELVQPGENGLLVAADDVPAMAQAVATVGQLDRAGVRRWAERHCSREAFAERVEGWLLGRGVAIGSPL
ncbi:glycosyltransferase [Synechococcus sp. RSCCF101]|uniref:glycosyltransferase n=1 Tax=Synechococcus sp. RSCCF101 TaxID=2511069 RepID=UPI0012482C46|nr:glycosyltransferase [Synechococcus sp. RSCCF101]QEY30926.1 glycosyltransferase [Synechococcus sp. RSCCF101]